MSGPYLFEPVACTPASGWEKGQVENQVGVIRRRFFVPRPKFKSYAELNAWLQDRCIAWAKANPHPEFRDKTIWEVFEGEPCRANGPSDIGERVRAWCPMPVRSTASMPCQLRCRRHASCASTATVTRWMRAPSAVRSRVSHRVAMRSRPMANAYADRIEIWQDGQVVGQHDRVFGRDHAVYDPLHYIPVLARKPGALRSEPSSRHRFETDGERPLQGLGTAACHTPDPAQARACPGRRSSDGGNTGRVADRRGRGGRGRLRRGTWPGRPLRRCRPQHSRPTPGSRAARADCHPGRAEAGSGAGRRLRPI